MTTTQEQARRQKAECALGATRRQLAVAGLAETLVVGVVGSVAGWAGGIGIAALLKGVFDGFGFALPAGGLVLRASSSVLAVAVGVAATVLAGALPARAQRPGRHRWPRCARWPPNRRRISAAACRQHGALLLAGRGRARSSPAAAGGGQGAGDGRGGGDRWPGSWCSARPPPGRRPVLGAPIAGLRGVGGRLARDNALRNPRRTAATASALMVGVAVADHVHRDRGIAEGERGRRAVSTAR